MSPPSPKRREEARRRRPDASMTLITSMIERPLDPGYAAVADARQREGLPRSTGTATPLLAVTAVVFGLLLGVAAATLRDTSQGVNDAKTQLVERVQRQQDAADETAARVRRIQDQLSTSEAVGGSSVRAAELDRLRVLAGSSAVTGPGMTITLDDAPGQDGTSADGNPRTTQADDGRVLARDLQIVVNALWRSGAEAIAVNGHRLNARSAIRFAGDAILVNFRPLTRPYTIEAIGSPNDLQTTFAAGPGGSYLTSLHDNYGIQTDMAGSDELTLPGAVTGSLRSATVIGTTGAKDDTGTRRSTSPSAPTSTPSGGPTP